MGVQSKGKIDEDFKHDKREVNLNTAKELEDAEEAARYYVKGGKLKKAIRLYEKCAIFYEENARKYAEFGRSDLAKHDYTEAAKAYRNAGRLKRVLSGKFKPMSKPSKLEKASITTAIIGIFGALLLLSSNITGNSISNLNQTTSNWIGGILFIIGLAAAFVYFRRR